jgi:hypothetical protein
MQIIQPHYHAIARTAQDYERMAMSGVVAVAEPAFWAGFDRAYPQTFLDYFLLGRGEPEGSGKYPAFLRRDRTDAGILREANGVGRR